MREEGFEGGGEDLDMDIDRGGGFCADCLENGNRWVGIGDDN